MTDLPCIKINQVTPLVVKMEKIKKIITDCVRERNVKINSVGIEEEFKKNLTKELDKKLTLTKNKYLLLYNKLYEIIDKMVKCECCSNLDHECKGDVFCLEPEESKKIWNEMDGLFSKIINFYEEIKNKLLIEIELCLYRINRIKKIKFFD